MVAYKYNRYAVDSMIMADSQYYKFKVECWNSHINTIVWITIFIEFSDKKSWLKSKESNYQNLIIGINGYLEDSRGDLEVKAGIKSQQLKHKPNNVHLIIL